ncbi:unnamed protein product [Pylaiella littoralis]
MEANNPDDGMASSGENITPSHPTATNSWQRVGTNTMIGAAGGAIGGTLLATYRGHSVPFYAASMGTNYGLASLMFFGTETLIRNARGGRRDALGYAGAGLTAGVAMTFPIGGRYQAVVAGITMAAVGYGGFYAHRRARAFLDELGQEELRKREQERKQQLNKRTRLADGPNALSQSQHR